MPNASKILFTEGDAPGTPGSGLTRLYAKTDHLLYSKDSAGAERQVSSDLTLTALATGFSVAGGTTSKSLTVELDSVINQDLSTDSTTSAFANLTISKNAYPTLFITDTSANDVQAYFRGGVNKTGTGAGDYFIANVNTGKGYSFNINAVSAFEIDSSLNATFSGSVITSAVKPASTGTLSLTDHDGLGITVAHGGFIGLGATSPDGSYRVTIEGNSSAVGPGIYFNDTVASPNIYSLYINGSKNFVLRDVTGAKDIITALPSGNVTIGSGTGTAGKLDVRDGNSVWSNTNVAHGMTTIVETSTYALLNPVSNTVGGVQIWGLSDGDGTALQLIGTIGATDPTDTTAALQFFGGKKNGTGWDALAATETVLKVQNYTTDLITVLGSGKVGIGTTSPDGKLNVSGTWPQIRIDASGADDTVGLNIYTNGVYRGWLIYNNTVGALEIQNYANGSGGSLLLNPQYGGNVGIGTASPETKLEIGGIPDSDFLTFSQSANSKHTLSSYMGGTANVSYLSFNINNGTGALTNNVLTLKGGGNVGIGTTTPAGKLDVRDGNLVLSDADVAHGMTDLVKTTTFARFAARSVTAGGLEIVGLSDADNIALDMLGIIGSADPTDTVQAINFCGAKKNGTGYQALAAAETVLKVQNLSTDLITVLGSGASTFLEGIAIGNATFEAGSTNTFNIKNGTAPDAHVDNQIIVYSVDSSDNTATLGLFLEQAVEDIGTFTPSHKIKVKINGTEYWLQLDAV